MVARLNGVQEAGSSNLLTQTKASRTLLVRDAFFQKPPLTRIVPPLLSPLKNARRSRTPRFLRCSKTIVQYARFCSAVSLRQKRIAMSARFPHTLIRSVLELRVHLFGVEPDSHVNLFGVEPPSQTCTGRSPLASRRRRSECRGRDEKCVSNAPFSSRSGRIASGITWRRRRGAVLGSPHARAPKVSPKMVGSLLRGNDFGGNPQEGGNNTSLSRERNPPN